MTKQTIKIKKAVVQLTDEEAGTQFYDVEIHDHWILVENTWIPRERVQGISVLMADEES